jgi:2-oxo-3-hexenedioate decarboxylase/2-keto-4-pentenoate hydratase
MALRRFPAGVLSLVADDFSSGCVLGPDSRRRPWRAMPTSPAASPSTAPSAAAARPATSSAIPELAAWLADHRAALGLPLRAGEIITLGSIVAALRLERSCLVEASFDGLGAATVTVT